MSDIAIVILSIFGVVLLFDIAIYFIYQKLYKNSISYYIRLANKESQVRHLYKGKKNRAKNTGNIGENIVEFIIKKYTKTYYTNVIIKGRKPSFYSEVEFIIPTRSGYELVEVKTWYGKVSLNKEHTSKVFLDFVNHYGKHVINERDNPYYVISFFRRDFIQFINNEYGLKLKKDNVTKNLVFARNELDFSNLKAEYPGSNTNFFHKDDFEKHLQDLYNNNEFSHVTKKFKFPTWDKCYDPKRNRWWDVIIRSESLFVDGSTINISDISAILFKDEKTIIKLRSGKIIRTQSLYFDDISINFSEDIHQESISFYLINKELHNKK